MNLHPQLIVDSCYLGELELCSLLLLNNSNYPWFVLVPRVQVEVTEIFELTDQERNLLIAEVSKVAAFCKKLYKADKVNIAAFGNQVPQLHVHIIMRFAADATFPKPVFSDSNPATPYTEDEVEIIKTKIASLFK